HDPRRKIRRLRGRRQRALLSIAQPRIMQLSNNKIEDFLRSRHLALPIVALSTVLGFLTLFTGNAPAQAPIPRRPDGKPDLTGIWDTPGSAHKSAAYPGTVGVAAESASVTSDVPSMTTWAKEIFARNRRGITNPRDHGRPDLDPSEWCYPPGPARLFTDN